MPDPVQAPQLMQEIAHQHLFNQFWLSLFFIIPMVLVARAVVAGTRYSAILIIVIFGLLMGFLLVVTGVSKPGLADFPMLGMIAQSTIIALAASFFCRRAGVATHLFIGPNSSRRERGLCD